MTADCIYFFLTYTLSLVFPCGSSTPAFTNLPRYQYTVDVDLPNIFSAAFGAIPPYFSKCAIIGSILTKSFSVKTSVKT